MIDKMIMKNVLFPMYLGNNTYSFITQYQYIDKFYLPVFYHGDFVKPDIRELT